MAKIDSDGCSKISDVDGDCLILRHYDSDNFLQLDLRENIHVFVNFNKSQVADLIVTLQEYYGRFNEC